MYSFKQPSHLGNSVGLKIITIKIFSFFDCTVGVDIFIHLLYFIHPNLTWHHCLLECGKDLLNNLNLAFQFCHYMLNTSSKIASNITTSRRFKCVFLKWLIPLDVVAWRLSLFLWILLSVASEIVSNKFGFIRFEKGEIFWKETSKRLQKTGTMLQLRDHEWTDLWTYPFVRDVWMIMK